MTKSISARIAECEEKIAMYQARYDKADSDRMREKHQKAIDSWTEKLEEAQASSMRSLEKSEKTSVRSTISLGNELWDGEDKNVTFEDEYTEILKDVSLPTIDDSAARHRDLLKKIRVTEIACGLLHDTALENASIEELESHLKSIMQQAARQAKSISNMAVNMYVGLLINGPTIINHYSDDLGFYVDRDVLNGSLRSQETMDNLRDAFNEIFEDSPELKQVMGTMFRGVPKLVAVTAMAFAPTIRLGSAPPIEKKV